MKAAASPSAQIIPGLPDNIALLCLSKVPRIYHTCLASVCIAWRNAVSRPEFYQERRRRGSTDAWLVVISAEILSPTLLYSAYDLSTRQLLFKVRFPPTLPSDGHISCAKAPAYGVDLACRISLLGAPGVTADCNSSLGVGVHDSNKLTPATFAENFHVRNAAQDSRFGEGAAGWCSYQGQDSMSLNAAKKNSKAMDETLTSHAAAALNVAACLQKLDYYRIVAMNEYFAVLGFTQRSRVCAPMCTFTIYNTVTDKWRQARPLAVCREMLACGVIEGRLYVVGGYNEKGETERSMEVYDFEADKWGTAEALPEWVGKVQGDVVYQGKLYVQCWEEGGDGKCVVLVYSPKEGKWAQLKGRNLAGGQTLVATDKFMYAMGGQEEVVRYEASSGEWTTVGRRQSSTSIASSTNKLRPRGQVVRCCCVNPHTSQRAFGHGDEVFVLQETNGAAPCGLPCDAATKCRRLVSVKPSWYHAGAVVQA